MSGRRQRGSSMAKSGGFRSERTKRTIGLGVPRALEVPLDTLMPAIPAPDSLLAGIPMIVTPSLVCPNCGAPEVVNPDDPVDKWRFNIRAYRVDDWSECRKCGVWFNRAGEIQR